MEMDSRLLRIFALEIAHNWLELLFFFLVQFVQ